MRKIYWLRRTAFLLTVFAMGTLIAGELPNWLKIMYPTAVMIWLIAYDDAIFEHRSRRWKEND
ncbi:hypothetical protein [Enterococcus sp. OL5]|uniref:hypothetical protein n=1 Tax=Enterococcus sp. OL5 TaxID=2590214 RepID=UPI00112E2FBE|nr:hypothetical protein [Enterococcus sp. OL5]TPR56267.1 hypothetical protein FJU10_12665 [Enterococcus sp. OL5]